MKLIENENNLGELDGIVITNFRVYKQSKEQLSVIPIKQIGSVELRNNSYPFLLAAGVTLLIAGTLIFF